MIEQIIIVLLLYFGTGAGVYQIYGQFLGDLSYHILKREEPEMTDKQFKWALILAILVFWPLIISKLF